MGKRYYSNYNQMKASALSYRPEWFVVEQNTAECMCGTKQASFTISEREDGDVIERMICCPVCGGGKGSTIQIS